MSKSSPGRHLGIATCIVALHLVVAHTAAQDADAAEGRASPNAQPAATSFQPAQSDGLVMNTEELAALGLDADQPAFDTTLQLSGFADFGFSLLLAPEDSYWRASGAVAAHSTFLVGSLNVYVAKQLTASVRTMAEVRFSYLPNGSSPFGFGETQSTVAFDYLDFGRQTRWGSIILQRVYVEWSPHSLLTIRGGQFLSPFGVWNVDHGSPVVIPVRRPFSVGAGWIPEKQTGLELFGRLGISSQDTLGYHLTLSNGDGPISEYADLDENKAIGGRVFWENRDLGSLRVGGGFYYGRYTNGGHRAAYLTPEGGSLPKVVSEETIALQYDSLTFAFDLTWDLGSLHVQTEWMFNQRAYTRQGRAQIPVFDAVILPSDTVSWGGYGLIGYRLPWLGIMPFILSERAVGEMQLARISLASIQFGLNIRPIDSLVVKASIDHLIFIDGQVDSLNTFMAQVAWAF